MNFHRPQGTSINDRQDMAMQGNQNFNFKKEEDPINSGQNLLFSKSPKEIESGILLLQSFFFSQKDFCVEIIRPETLQRLNELCCNEEIHFLLKNKILELVLLLCESNTTFIHKFWILNLYKKLLDILKEDICSVNLESPIKILSKMAKWTDAARSVLIQNDFLNILVNKISSNGPVLSSSDYYFVFFGISCLLEKNKENTELIVGIINIICNFILNSNASNEVLAQALLALSSALYSCENIHQCASFLQISQFSVEILSKIKIEEARLEIVEFICNAIFMFDESAQIFLDLKIFDLFYMICQDPSDHLIIKCISATTNCLLSSPNASNDLDNSNFLETLYQYLQTGSNKVKQDVLNLFQVILSFNNKYFNQEFALKVLEKYNVIEIFADFLTLDGRDKAYVLLTCLSAIYSAIMIYSHTNHPKPTPPIMLMMDQSNYLELQRLTEYNERDVQNYATLIIEEIRPYI